MKNIELKYCPNCKERIGIHDIECPYCKYIDDPKYKKHNNKLKERKKNKNEVYKLMLLIPIFTYLFYSLFRLDLIKILIPLVLVNLICFKCKKVWIFIILSLELVVLFINFISNLYKIIIDNSHQNLLLQVFIFIFGILFIVIPKIMYLIKIKKKIK